MQEDGGQRFAVLTFDDGYRDNVTRALPILELHDAPFTIFVPTGAPTRTLYSWWLGLRALFRMSDTVTIDVMGRRFDCPDLGSKTTALAMVTHWIYHDLRRAQMLAPTFATAGISLTGLTILIFWTRTNSRRLLAIGLRRSVLIPHRMRCFRPSTPPLSVAKCLTIVLISSNCSSGQSSTLLIPTGARERAAKEKKKLLPKLDF